MAFQLVKNWPGDEATCEPDYELKHAFLAHFEKYLMLHPFFSDCTVASVALASRPGHRRTSLGTTVTLNSSKTLLNVLFTHV